MLSLLQSTRGIRRAPLGLSRIASRLAATTVNNPIINSESGTAAAPNEVSVTEADLFSIVLPTNENSENLLKIRHSSAHVMAMAVQKLFPGVRVTIGPWIENGFYYDFHCPDKQITDADLKAIKKEMDKIVRANLPITREEITREEARFVLILSI